MLTLKFKNAYIQDWFSIAGFEENNGLLTDVNLYLKDYYYGESTLEDAEVKMQRTVLNNLRSKHDFEVVIGGDLSNQLGIMNISMKEYPISFLGIYNACATFCEGLLLGANLLTSGNAQTTCVLTSSHNLTSERQFRFPVEYGAMKKSYTTSTTTAAVGCILSNAPTNIKIVSATIGSVTDYGIKDVYNMGAVMAPAAAKVIHEHLVNEHKKIADYDVILTGDLGTLGVEILCELYKKEYNENLNNLSDAGSLLYKSNQNKYTGGSGPSVLPLVFFNKILKSKKNKRILLVATGALHNPTLVNQKNAIPSIAHAVEIEVLK